MLHVHLHLLELSDIHSFLSMNLTPSPPSPSQIHEMFDFLASYNLTFPTAPYWAGASVVGAIGTGSHGSTLRFKVGRWEGGREGGWMTGWVGAFCSPSGLVGGRAWLARHYACCYRN